MTVDKISCSGGLQGSTLLTKIQSLGLASSAHMLEE